ncbi:MAG: NADH-quinone oxidoreductase subunit J, partial [Deltaproteobacteria bacterium]|nr:NADH-quinone oxidoreductase subunit J [Deltaproteobacteria bacterium]MCK5514239.1 NADH-quinone oxidoreductase subunit J [Deltaproteobacteria bacterium]
MEAILFYGLAAIMVVSSLMVILRKNPVHSALFLVLTFLCLAVLYLLLNAQFIAAIQVIVYAGAIMVLFIFVIM